MKILVTDGNNRAALAITRSLGKKGHIVIVGEHTHPSLASSSKYCKGRVTYPNPTSSPHEFIKTLLSFIVQNNIDAILPVSDVTTIPVCEFKDEIEKHCAVPFSHSEMVKLAADKGRLFHLAEELGVAVPKSQWLHDEQGIESLEKALTYPVVIKPSKSRILTEKGWLSTTVKYADGLDELKKVISEESPLAYPLLLQERIVGPGVGVFVCYDHGKPLAFFSHRRLREKPPSGGVSVLRESIDVSTLSKEFTEKLLGHMKWHGVAMVEFKLDNRDNIPKLMEINGRFWGSLQLAIDAGVDFPHLLIQTVQQTSQQHPVTYTSGIRTRWLLGDIDALMMVLFKNKKQLKLQANYRGRLFYLLDFLRLWQKDTYYEVLKVSDIRPWLFELKSWLFQKKK